MGFEILNHTDAGRESLINILARGLDEAAARGWTVVDMKTDWKTVFKP